MCVCVRAHVGCYCVNHPSLSLQLHFQPSQVGEPLRKQVHGRPEVQLKLARSADSISFAVIFSAGTYHVTITCSPWL